MSLKHHGPGKLHYEYNVVTYQQKTQSQYVNYRFKWKLDLNAEVLGTCEIITFGFISTKSYSSCQKLGIEVAILRTHIPWSTSRVSTVHQAFSFIFIINGLVLSENLLIPEASSLNYTVHAHVMPIQCHTKKQLVIKISHR